MPKGTMKNQNFIADGLSFRPTTPDATYSEVDSSKIYRIASNLDNAHSTYSSDCRRSSLSVNIDTPSLDSDDEEERFLDSDIQEAGYFSDVFPNQFETDEESSSSTYYSVMESEFPEQLELCNYKILSQIGDGAFSRVFKAVNVASIDQIPVAIKVIKKKSILCEYEKHEHDAENGDRIKPCSRENILNEIFIHRLVSENNPYLVKFLGFQESVTYFYIISELVSGGEIFDKIIQMSSFSEDLARHVITQVAMAVKHMHYMGVVHRDIKPENLLFEPIPFYGVDGDEFKLGVGGGGIGFVKLTDFGLAKRISHNAAKTPCGTIEYTAPEIFNFEGYSMKVDMWGIGCVLYTLLCGYPPFYEKNPSKLVKKISEGDYEFSAPWWDGVSSEAKNAISHLLEVDPNKRYDIDEFLNDPWLNTYDCLRPSTLNDQPASEYAYATVEDILNGSFDKRAENLRSAFERSYQLQEQDDTESHKSASSQYIYMAENDEHLRNSWSGELNEAFSLNLKRSSVYRRRKSKVSFW
ncbi:hypothetical protein SUVC_07G0950 [Saccharomyces uvarum]|uniref:Protein kinase domain-containing protein n=1 Tax=Saccharomyces uvarum TaxID=230603 RepID=A0AA35JI54_SACUV|nr:hypothetical protein SUVC_07G0950 [Saccharomyces uvarum]